MIFLVLGILLGVIFYSIGSLGRDLEASHKRMFKLAGLLLATLGAMIWLSALYINHSGTFTVLALSLGALMAILGHYKNIENLVWPGYGSLLTGMLMLVMKPGWLLFFVLAGIAAVIYFKLIKTGKVEEIITTIDQKLPKY